MKYENGLVSVIIPTYHRADSLQRAIDSVLKQTYKNLECILVNDNIPDDDYSNVLYSVIHKYEKDNRFIFLEQSKHINGAAARNYGIEHAKGEFIAFLDDDDWWKNDKIEKQIKFFRSCDNECGGVSTLVEYYSEGKLIQKSLPYKSGKIYKEILMRDIDVTTCSLLLKHEYLDKTGYFDINLKRHQEIQLLTFFTYYYELCLLPEHLVCITADINENRPNSEKMKKQKEALYQSVRPIMGRMLRTEQQRIRDLNKFEVAFCEIKERKYGNAIKDACAVFRNPKTLFYALRRVFTRIQEKRHIE